MARRLSRSSRRRQRRPDSEEPETELDDLLKTLAAIVGLSGFVFGVYKYDWG